MHPQSDREIRWNNAGAKLLTVLCLQSEAVAKLASQLCCLGRKDSG